MALPGSVASVVLIDPVTGLPYSAAPAGGSTMGSPDWTASLLPGASGITAPLVGGRTRMKRFIRNKTLAAISTVAKCTVVAGGATVADVAAVDAPYGTTAVQVTATGAQTTIYGALNAVPTDVTGGFIRLWFKCISNYNTLDRFFIQLFSLGTPAAPSVNFSRTPAFTSNGAIGQIVTSLAGTGRWQSICLPLAYFSEQGTLPATLTAITYAAINIRSTTTSVVQIGNIEFIPNALTKAKCIFCFDDGYQSQLTYAAPALMSYGFPAVLFPSPITGVIDSNAGFLTSKQLQQLHDVNGWQIASQAWTTESNTIIDAMSADTLTSEFARLRNWQASLGLTGGEFGSYFSNVSQTDMTPSVLAAFQKHFRAIRAFFLGAGASPAFPYSETFPFGDPSLVRALAGATWTDATNAAKLQAHVDQAIAQLGVALIVYHDDLASPGNVRTGFDSLLAYLDANRATIDVCREEDLPLAA